MMLLAAKGVGIETGIRMGLFVVGSHQISDPFDA